MGYERIINCVICGEITIVGSARGKYCKECAKEQNNIRKIENKKNSLIRKAAKERKKHTIAEINGMAQREGLTYGKYVAKMECEKRKAAAKNATAS